MTLSSILILVIICFMVLPIFHVFGAPLKCVVYSDDKLVIVQIRTVTFSYSGGTSLCDGRGETISWFISHGYNITAFNDLEVYLTH